MSLSERLIKEFEELSDVGKNEVIDFVEFLKLKEKKNMTNLMDDIIKDNDEAFKELAK
jgi:hypothetical protein